MPKVIRVALPGYNALTDNDPRHFSLMSDQDNILIKELIRGTTTVDGGDTVSINHNLGYIPVVLVFMEAADGTVGTSGRWFQLHGIDSNWLFGITVTTTDLNIISSYIGSDTKNCKYYIFYDQQV